MSVNVVMRINDELMGELEIVRELPYTVTEDPTQECLYKWTLVSWTENPQRSAAEVREKFRGKVCHRIADGPWALVAKVMSDYRRIGE
jgi:hypothetical protein